jgi:hypothetical protein
MLLGNLSVTSNMGDPLQVRIAVSDNDDSSLRDECFRLTGQSSRMAPLDQAHLELVSIGGKRYVSISTRTPANDPILDLTLRTEGCGATMQKDYVVLLTPKNLSADDAPAMVSPPISETTMPPIHSARTAPRPKIPFQQRHAPRQPKAQQAVSAQPHREQAPKQAARFMLRLDYGFGSLATFAEQVAKQKQQAQNSAVIKPAPAKPLVPETGKQPGQAAQGDKLVLQPPAHNNLQPTQPSAAHAPVDAGTANQTPQANGVTAQAPGNIGNNQIAGNPATEPQHGAVAVANPPKSVAMPASEPWYQGLFSSLNMLLLALFLVLLIALWLKKRTPSSRFLDKTRPDFNTLMPADPEDPQQHPLLSRNLPPVDQVFPESPEAKTLLADPFEHKANGPKTVAPKLAEIADFAPKLNPMGDFTVEQFDSTDHVLELAEVMLAFGRSSQAIDTLSQYIRNNPDQAVEPWLKLLDLYFKSNLRNEFEALATDLHKRFNVVIADWKDFEPAKGLPMDNQSLTLESLPHIMDRLTSTWGRPEGLNYLDTLLADNRGGQRHGFSLPLVRDILLLRDILRLSSPVPTPIH